MEVEDELEHTDVERKSSQEQPKPHGHFDWCLQFQEIICMFTPKRVVVELATEQTLVWTYCNLESSETS